MGLPPNERVILVCAGLTHLGDRLRVLKEEIEAQSPGVAAELLIGVAGEEAGKSLILLDLYRSPAASQKTMSRQLKRASQHLPKLLYRQVVDYQIASRNELISALERHRLERYLDGPNDVDWVFRNDLIAWRENDMYVDLVRTESGLEWRLPLPYNPWTVVPSAVRLVLALQDANLFSPEALARLSAVWADFDPTVDSRFAEWSARTEASLLGAPASSVDVAKELWPMPMTELDLELIPVSYEEISQARGE